jgi:trehalose 2-sulfotransferase
MRPAQSYIVWFSQRTGSTVFCRALEDTGIAGKPNELLNVQAPYDLLTEFGVSSYRAAQEKLWELGSTPNAVFGLNVSMHEPHNTAITQQLAKFDGCPCVKMPRLRIWENVFPNCRHIFMTRRNKVRLAVSWWKAIKSGQFHSYPGAKEGNKCTSADYSFEAIRHLMLDADMREAGMQELFTEAGVTPFTVVYEDFIANYEHTIRAVLDFLEIPERAGVSIPPPYYSRLADALSEEWTERFRKELQSDWQIRGWD